MLILALGANDGLRGLSVAEMKQNLGEIIEKARGKNVVVILAGMEAPPNYGADTRLHSGRPFAISRCGIACSSCRFFLIRSPDRRRSIKRTASILIQKERQSWQTRSGTC